MIPTFFVNACLAVRRKNKEVERQEQKACLGLPFHLIAIQKQAKISWKEKEEEVRQFVTWFWT